jgi:2-dehydropantoate 2-reductase
MHTNTLPEQAPAQPAVALIGAGAVGLVVAAAFARAGWGVWVCGARNPFARLYVQEAGQGAEFPVRHARSPAELGPCTVAVVAVKAYQTGDVTEWIAAFNRPDARILAVQNGLEHRERIAACAPVAMALPAIAYFNAQRSAPGCSVLRRIGPTDLCLPADAPVQDVAAALQAGGLRVVLAADMVSAIWIKLLANSAANPLTALCGRRTGVMREPACATNARQIMAEVARVGQAEGAALTAHHVEEAMTWLQSVPPESATSMLQDRLAGRPLEYDAITGAIVRAADRHGLDVPLNRFVLGLLSAIKPMQPS